MKTIYKYQLAKGEEQAIIMPKGAKILSVQVQRDKPCIWALVDNNAPSEARIFRIIATGDCILNNLTKLSFIGTFQVSGGFFVFHLFEVV